MIIIFRIHFLDEGRVDAILITYNGESIFIDSGFRYDGLSSIKYMKKLGITKLKYYISSHSHKNHCGGAAPIISVFNPDEILIPHDRVRERIIKYASSAEKSKVKNAKYCILTPKSEPIQWGDLTITCIGPLKVKNYLPWITAENYNSLILRIDRGERHMVLLTGDTSDSIMSAIEKKTPGALRAEVFKNAHHEGSHAFSVLKKIAPNIVAFCSSKLSSKTYRKRIKSIGADYYHACKKGSKNFVLEDTGEGWIFRKPSEVLNDSI